MGGGQGNVDLFFSFFPFSCHMNSSVPTQNQAKWEAAVTAPAQNTVKYFVKLLKVSKVWHK